MSLKKKLTMGIATGALAVSMIGGGTYAYFNSVETSVNTFAAGTLDLTVDPIAIISVDNLKPGDKMLRTFKLENTGTLDMKEVILSTDYTYTQKDGQEDVDFGKHIMVNFLKSDVDNGNNGGGNNGGGNNGGGNNGGGNNGGGNNGGGNNGG
ncbi:TasA family protein, partial [Sporosarcina koreensis]